MKIAFYGSSLLSSYWNGAATYYRGMLRALALKGHDITFYEPDVYDRQSHRDIDPPGWCKVIVYPGTLAGLRTVATEAGAADVIIKASGVGFEDDRLLEELLLHARSDALTLFWDVDAPATLATLREAPDHPLRQALAKLDLVLTYGGGDPVVSAYLALGARDCIPVYNALDPDAHHPVAPEPRFAADLAFLGNRLPDRERRVEEFFFTPAAQMPDQRFLLGGAGWDGRPDLANLSIIGHVGTADHNAFYASPKAIINISRDSMAETGFSPATRVFEAAGAGACLITDHWDGIELFLKPDAEVLVARDGRDVRELLAGLSRDQAEAIGLRAMTRILTEHTYAHRADQVDRLLRRTALARKEAVA